MSRHIGFYRPIGYKHNAFLLFYTPCPQKHRNVLKNIYQRETQLLDKLHELCGPSITPPQVLYTQRKFKNYKEVHSAIFKYLSKPNSDVKHTTKLWPSVTLTEQMLNNLDVDLIIDESISAIEKTSIE